MDLSTTCGDMKEVGVLHTYGFEEWTVLRENVLMSNWLFVVLCALLPSTGFAQGRERRDTPRLPPPPLLTAQNLSDNIIGSFGTQ